MFPLAEAFTQAASPSAAASSLAVVEGARACTNGSPDHRAAAPP